MPLDYQFVPINEVKGLEKFGDDLDKRCGENTTLFLIITGLKLKVSVTSGLETVARALAVTDSSGKFKNEYIIETDPTCAHPITGYSFEHRMWFVKEDGMEKVFFRDDLTGKKIGLQMKVYPSY